MSDFRINKITNRDGSAGTQIAGITTFSGTSGMVMPGGPTGHRGGRDRGVIGGGNNPAINSLEYITIGTKGNAVDFGDLISAGWGPGSNIASSTRGIFAGGYVNTPASTFYNTIQYVTISSSGGASEFGDLSVGNYRPPGASNNTRGIFGGGWTGTPGWTQVVRMDYVTIASTGDASNFGDLIIRSGEVDGKGNKAGLASPTRGIWAGGEPGGQSNVIEYVEIATFGDSKDFGDLSEGVYEKAGLSSPTRGVWGGGNTPSRTDVIEYVTIATLGNSTDFGNLLATTRAITAVSNSVRGVFAGGTTEPTLLNTIQYITIVHTGNALDFGDLVTGRRDSGACSDSHGGLG